MKKILFIAPLPPPFAGPEIAAKLFLESNLKNRFHLIHLNTTNGLVLSNKSKFRQKIVSNTRYHAF
ncbi:MAG TPA: hypothetical protein VJL89_13570 [Thermodesulfovibrionia bacterium]|nr:hypothetical protein [Thermodesulfovibrionia bacterium]